MSNSSPADYLTGRWQYLLHQFFNRIWFRASLFSFGAIAVALLAGFFGHYVPVPFQLELAAGSVDDILTILASSMLAVTTFSLSIMVNAYALAATNSTPRATSLLVADSVASNTLSTFIGSFLFAVVGIVGLSAGLYGESGRVILFIATLFVLFLVTAALLRWVEQLTHFGRVGDTIRRVETAGAQVAESWARQPRFGACPPPDDVAEGAAPVCRDRTGYIQHIDIEALNDCAHDCGAMIHVQCMPGDFVGPDTVLAFVPAELTDRMEKAIAACFTVGPTRSFDQDPKYALIVLSEIASRALSPGINDPGTAIQVLGAGVRVFEAYCDGADEEIAPTYERVSAPDIPYHELLEDFFNPIARDGGGMLEVQVRLQRALEMIAVANEVRFGEPAKRLAALALKRSLNRLDSNLERTRLRKVFYWTVPEELENGG